MIKIKSQSLKRPNEPHLLNSRFFDKNLTKVNKFVPHLATCRIESSRESGLEGASWKRGSGQIR